jgi:hypothetical protein
MTKRDFLKFAVGYVAGVFSFKAWQAITPLVRPLNIRIQGLSIIQKSANAVTIHFVNANKVGMGVHNAWLIVPDAMVDSSSTAASFLHPYDSSLRVFDLERASGPTKVTAPGTGGGNPDLDIDTTPIVPNTLPPANQWNSVNYAAQLGLLTGATAITDDSKFVANIQLEHGHLYGVQPAGAYGARTIWDFAASGQTIPSQALTDTLLCHITAVGSGPTFLIGNDTVVLNHLPGPPPEVTLSNLPPLTTTGVCAGPHPCLDHLQAIYGLVNASYTPTATGRVQGGVQVPDIEPNYCPPAML